MKGYEIKFNIYANSAEEVESARKAVTDFISTLARQGRAVSANKIAHAVSQWDSNSFIKSKILEFFS